MNNTSTKVPTDLTFDARVCDLAVEINRTLTTYAEVVDKQKRSSYNKGKMEGINEARIQILRLFKEHGYKLPRSLTPIFSVKEKL